MACCSIAFASSIAPNCVEGVEATAAESQPTMIAEIDRALSMSPSFVKEAILWQLSEDVFEVVLISPENVLICPDTQADKLVVSI